MGYIGAGPTRFNTADELTVTGDAEFNGNATFGDNDKAIFGAGSDLQIYHNGSHSYLEDQGTGNLYIKATNLRLNNSANVSYLSADSGGAVSVYHNGNQKLATTSSGIDVTGTVTADGLTVDTNTLHVDATNNRVGIGTAAPSAHLQVNGSLGNNTAILTDRNGTAAVTVDQYGATTFANTVIASNLATNSSGTDMTFSQGASEAMRISSGNVGIGTSSPSSQITLKQSAQNFAGGFRLERSDNTNNFTFAIDGSTKLNIGYNDSTKLVLDSSGNVGIGTSSPQEQIHSAAGGSNALRVSGGANDNKKVEIGYDNTNGPYIKAGSSGITGLQFYVDNTSLAATIDSSGNLLVGKTATGVSNYGFAARGVDGAEIARDDGTVLFMNRGTSDGTIVDLRQDGTTVGSIGVSGTNMYVVFRTEAATDGVGLTSSGASTGIIIPADGNGAAIDDHIDLGSSGNRFDDIYATNGTIQTSDANEKQQIASLTDAEITAAKAISALFKTFKWNSAVEEKGDAARTHAGVIAQDVEAAMTAAGLDAGDYAFFISTTWWETQTEVPAVEADEENGIEAQEAYTRTDTYETAEEAPDGATEHNRKGIRYPELLSFVGAATEQRLANIETRLAALEAN